MDGISDGVRVVRREWESVISLSRKRQESKEEGAVILKRRSVLGKQEEAW